MKDKAIEKINAELQKAGNNPYTEIVGHYIIDRCLDAACAEKVMMDGKTLKGAMDAIMERAKRAKQGSVAVLTPSEVFGAVDKYFGLSTNTTAQMAALGLASAPKTEPPKPQVVERAAAPIISLDDFL